MGKNKKVYIEFTDRNIKFRGKEDIPEKLYEAIKTDVAQLLHRHHR